MKTLTKTVKLSLGLCKVSFFYHKIKTQPAADSLLSEGTKCQWCWTAHTRFIRNSHE